MTKTKRVMSVLFALTIFATMFAGMRLVNVNAHAVEILAADSITSKLDAVISGTYGNGKYFPYHSGDLGSVPASLAGVAGGQQCFGYARYVFYQLFGIPAPVLIERDSDELSLSDTGGNGITLQEVASCKYSVSPNGNTASISKNAFANAKPGDIVQCRRTSGSAHTMIVYSVSDTSIKILDCNVMTNQPNIVLLRDETYSNFAIYNVNFTIYRSKNYPGSSVENPSTITSKLDKVVSGTYGNGKYFPYNSGDLGVVPASLAGVAGGQSSFGYARYVFYQLFGIPAPIWIEKNSDELSLSDTGGNGITLQEVASCKYSASPNGNTASISKNAFAKAKPGDFVQCRRKSGSTHSMIVYSISDTSIKILDCDVMLNQPNVALLRDETYSDFASYNVNFTIYRAKNYPG